MKKKDFKFCYVNCELFTFIIHPPIEINIHLPDHLLHFLQGQLLPQVHHTQAQLVRVDEPITVSVKHFKRLSKRHLVVFFVQIPTHYHIQKTLEVYESGACLREKGLTKYDDNNITFTS